MPNVVVAVFAPSWMASVRLWESWPELRRGTVIVAATAPVASVVPLATVLPSIATV